MTHGPAIEISRCHQNLMATRKIPNELDMIKALENKTFTGVPDLDSEDILKYVK